MELNDAARVASERLEKEKAKLKRRLERFGTTEVDEDKLEKGAQRMIDRNDIRALRGARVQHFCTGFDIFDPEQQEAMKKRAEKFALMKPPEESVATAAAATTTATAVEEEEEYVSRPVEFARNPEAALKEFSIVPRKEVDDSVERRWDTLHCHGTDVMSSREVMDYFVAYDPCSVEWICDSSCNVVFSDVYTARRALHSVGSAIISKDSSDNNNENQEELSSAKQELLWWSGRIWSKPGKQPVTMLVRFATVLDTKPSVREKSQCLWMRPDERRKHGITPKAKVKDLRNLLDRKPGATARGIREGGDNNDDGGHDDGGHDDRDEDFDLPTHLHDLRQTFFKKKRDAPDGQRGYRRGDEDDGDYANEDHRRVKGRGAVRYDPMEY